MINSKNAIVFFSNTDTKGKKDATGAFIPEAKKFASYHGIPETNMFGIKCPGVSRQKRAEAVFDGLYEARKLTDRLESVSFFGHGWPAGIQFGFNKKNVDELSRQMAVIAAKDLKVTLYACLAAENETRDSEIKNIGVGTDGGFADLLRDSLYKNGVTKGWVDAHKTAGHTSWNPYVIRFLCEICGPEGGEGGSWLVEPRSQFWKKWVKALRHELNFRYAFPFYTELELKNILGTLNFE